MPVDNVDDGLRAQYFHRAVFGHASIQSATGSATIYSPPIWRIIREEMSSNSAAERSRFDLTLAPLD